MLENLGVDLIYDSLVKVFIPSTSKVLYTGTNILRRPVTDICADNNLFLPKSIGKYSVSKPVLIS
jgi:hypothetical protein